MIKINFILNAAIVLLFALVYIIITSASYISYLFLKDTLGLEVVIVVNCVLMILGLCMSIVTILIFSHSITIYVGYEKNNTDSSV